MNKTKVNKDGTIELGDDFVDAFRKCQQMQIASLESMLKDKSPEAMAARAFLDQNLAAEGGSKEFEKLIRKQLKVMKKTVVKPAKKK